MNRKVLKIKNKMTLQVLLESKERDVQRTRPEVTSRGHKINKDRLKKISKDRLKKKALIILSLVY